MAAAKKTGVRTIDKRQQHLLKANHHQVKSIKDLIMDK